MRGLRVLVIVTGVLVWFSMAGCKSGGKVLPVKLYAQQTPHWCWAAGGAMIMKYVGNYDITQCKEANDRFGFTECCEIPTPPKCVKGGWPLFQLYGFTASHTEKGHALSWNQLVAQIDNNKPVGFAWEWTGGGGHYMVAKGYSTGMCNMVAINDPWPWNTDVNKGGTSKLISYSEYVKSSTHTHLVDDYNITKIPLDTTVQ